MNNKKKVVFTLVASVFLATVIAFAPRLWQKKSLATDGHRNEKMILAQKILRYEKEPREYYKLYNQGKLVAIITNYQRIQQAIKEEYEKHFAQDYPNSECGLLKGVYITKENVYFRVENKDEAIIHYLQDGRLGVKATVVEFSTKDGVYEAIYVKDVDDYNRAQNRFLQNFVSAASLRQFRRGEAPNELSEYGVQDMSLRIQETVSTREVIANPKDIFTREEEIYDFLCYGRNQERQYYTVQEGDTLAGVGFRFHDMSASQIMMLNPGVITSTNQVLVAGLSLNVTYYTSPLTVVVTKQRLSKEILDPENPQYIEDPNLSSGEYDVKTAEANGYRNLLYQETWINGVQQEGSILQSSKIMAQPVRAVIHVGTKPLPNVGTGNFIWPIDNVSITCGWGCYPGHQGTDLQNMYNRYDNVYAADNGTVEMVTYDSIGGNWILINHNNGYETYYGHLNVPAFPKVGDTVTRGQIIGQIGMTGYATGPHTHFEIRVNGSKVDACTIMPCDTVPWR